MINVSKYFMTSKNFASLSLCAEVIPYNFWLRSKGRVEFLLDVLFGALGWVALDDDGFGVKKGRLECELLLSGFSEPVLVLNVDDLVVIGCPDCDSHGDPGHKLDDETRFGVNCDLGVEILLSVLFGRVD